MLHPPRFVGFEVFQVKFTVEKRADQLVVLLQRPASDRMPLPLRRIGELPQQSVSIVEQFRHHFFDALFAGHAGTLRVGLRLDRIARNRRRTRMCRQRFNLNRASPRRFAA
jgi:hypothetical protein